MKIGAILMSKTQSTQRRKPPPAELLGLPKRLHRAMAEVLGGEERGRQAKLARRAGVSSGQLTPILEGGRLKGIQAAMVIRLADALGINAGWLLTGRGEMFGANVPVLTPDDVREIAREEFRKQSEER